MARFLLWNVQRKPLANYVLGLVQQHALDAVLLVEAPTDDGSVFEILSQHGFTKATSASRFGVYHRNTLRFAPLSPIVLSDRASFWHVFGSTSEGLLGLIHGLDRRNHSDGSRMHQLRTFAANIQFFESSKSIGHRRTVLAGDFNANPFEPAMVSVNGLHAIGTRSIRGETARTFSAQTHDYFYNPMWRLFGYGIDSASATHYHNGYTDTEHLWHMLDQVVLRPEAMEQFVEPELRILTGTMDLSFTDAHQCPNARTASDRFPVVFRWNL
ncbi:endonuclease/exonuclease/phosphatase family protein [Limnoglobus roseus]|uniref:Endonuclease/exonuclease/phosphatase family protein n=1 Tax=Limnoglobus roseus TaxID=2598579 RepID=A0A5C1AC21_9BACT|nr:endonuclease/exonuclease/phosphatase family protein [Limnoglobus roseus]QEL16125.1 endonuclease/exonuclease/phosphatase family protein [Limnoglobus roseus]